MLCSLGFTWHPYRILDLSINGELTCNLDYEIEGRIQMPTVAFYLPINVSLVKENHQLTENYLENLTSAITVESVFQNIVYLKKLSEWTPLDRSLVERFFFIHLECVRIRIDQEYDQRQFYFSTNHILEVLKKNFSNRLVSPETKKKIVYLMNKTSEAVQLSNIVDLAFIKEHLFAGDKDDFSNFDGYELHTMKEGANTRRKKLILTANRKTISSTSSIRYRMLAHHVY